MTHTDKAPSLIRLMAIAATIKNFQIICSPFLMLIEVIAEKDNAHSHADRGRLEGVELCWYYVRKCCVVRMLLLLSGYGME